MHGPGARGSSPGPAGPGHGRDDGERTERSEAAARSPGTARRLKHPATTISREADPAEHGARPRGTRVRAAATSATSAPTANSHTRVGVTK